MRIKFEAHFVFVSINAFRFSQPSRFVLRDLFSSRRDNGLYTLPYICHIGKDGKPSKPFLLPQEDPDKYDYQLYSYNIPELTKGAVEVSPYEIQQVAEKNKPEQVRFK